MSAELIAIVSAFAVLGVGMFAGFGWIVRRMDALEDKLTSRTDALEDKLTSRTDALEDKLTSRTDARIDALDEKLSNRLDAVKDELTEVKVAIARIEGPPRHLIPAR